MPTPEDQLNFVTRMQGLILSSHGQTIFQYDPRSTGAEAYEKLASEVLGRVGLAAPQTL